MKRELNFIDEGIIFTVTVGYFKKCVTFLLQLSRFFETIIIFEERKGYNLKADDCPTSRRPNCDVNMSRRT